MKIKKSLALFSACAALCLGGLTVFSGCFTSSNKKFYEVTDMSEVRNDKQNFKLTQDIDYENGAERILMCTAYDFDGDGHTIKNLNLRGQYSGNSGQCSIFFSVHSVKNLYIENLNINVSNYTHIATLAWGDVELIENVHIKNLTINATQPMLGSGLGRSVKEIFVGGFAAGSVTTVRNCTIENSTITVKGYNNSNHDHIADMHVAGIAVSPSDISYCGIENTTIKAESTSAYSDLEVGGLTSRSDGRVTVTSCYAYNNNITAEASWSSKSQYSSKYSTAYAYVGGIAVTASSVNFCSARNNNITAAASGSLLAGAVVGKTISINQSIARNNSVVCTGGRSDNEDTEIYRATGGLAGRVTGEVTSCISINNTATDSATHTVVKGSNNLYAGGLAGRADSTAVNFKTSKCFVGGNTVNGDIANDVAVGYNGHWDIFIDTTVSFNDTDTAVIANQNDLKSPEWVVKNMALNADAWILEEGEWPEINTVYVAPEEDSASQ